MCERGGRGFFKGKYGRGNETECELIYGYQKNEHEAKKRQREFNLCSLSSRGMTS